ncbi:YqkE family protein [Fervidibacillus halotolerans]|uniref:YqkE family protein n=1 Tax=Fervidibacillus halotolerans TaxID=2980027 RepID=A0A9E8S044_9BACI|nr:YqkE family protein [Fervidibacillus halotolerans]WAA13829.1 YqkE family protein [Fervidibacillus halotolerans]
MDKKENKVSIKETLDSNVLSRLQQKKKELKALEEQKRKQEEMRIREERKRREQSKTFEQLLDESNLDWKQFK